MEFQFSINSLLKDDISLIDNKLVPPRNFPAGKTVYHSQLCNIIDKMGEASGKAQGLHGPITSATKLMYSDHCLYLLKDPQANGERGAVVGLIKTGHKKLFVYDRHGNQHEMEPLCILDFYVHESRQRMGCGKRLFEHALKESNMKPQHIAIDRPSHKFLSFLQKHYNLKGTIPQVNNFVVFDGFFRDRPVHKRRLSVNKPPLYPYKKNGPESHNKPLSRPSSRVLNGPPSPHDPEAMALLQKQKEAFKDIPLQRPPSRERASSSSSLGRTGSASSSPVPGNLDCMRAHQNMYSRHCDTPINGGHAATPPLPQGRHTATPPLPQSRQVATPPLPQGRHVATPPLPIDQLSTRENSHSRVHKGNDPPLLGRDGPSKDFLQMKNGLCHHREYQDSKGHLKVTRSPETEANQIISNNNNYRGSKSAYPIRDVSPGNPDNRLHGNPDHRHHGNTHNNHLPPGNPYVTHSAKARLKHDSTLNIFGVPSGYQNTTSAKKYQHTRLW